MLLGCGDDPAPESDAPLEDVAGDVEETTIPNAPDPSPDLPPDPGPAPGPTVATAALLLDLDMQHPVTWSHVDQGLRDAGFDVTYRRWFPHVTAEDADIERWGLIVIGGGGGPNRPSPTIRDASVDHLIAFVKAGGGVLFAPRNGWLDSTTGAVDRSAFNRLAEQTGAALRVERNTAIGNVFFEGDDGSPPQHFDTLQGYAGSLEWTLNPPLAYRATDHPAAEGLQPAAAGWASTLACAGDEVAVIAQTWTDIIVWWDHAQTDSSIAILEPKQPLAALSPADEGWIAAAPRGLLTVAAHSGEASDEPILNPDRLEGAAVMTRTFVRHVGEVVLGAAEHTPRGCHLGSSPLPGPAEVAFPPKARPVPDEPPTPPDWAALPVLEAAEPTAQPDWFTAGRAHLVYGNIADPDLPDAFATAASAGLNGVQLTVGSAALATPPEDPAWYAAADQAASSGLHVLVGGYWKDAAWSALKSEIGTAHGAWGQTLDAPPPLSDTFWKAGVEDVVLGAATASLAAPGIGGVHFDTELYGAGSLWYAPGYFNDETTFGHIVDAVTAHDPATGAELAALPDLERLPWLVDRGLVGWARRLLEDAVAERAAAIREQAHAIAPGFTFSFYAPLLSNTWFYRGLLRGFGAPDHPALFLTYESATATVMDTMRAEGIHARHLSGVLGVLFQSTLLDDAVRGVGISDDGFWLFALGDFPAAATERWNAVTAAVDALVGSPLP